jgi:hypothetical protein
MAKIRSRWLTGALRRAPGAGCKSKYGVKTIVMRLPENRVQDVENLLGRGGLECVTESKHEIVTKSVESITESKAEPIEDIRRIVERWGELLKPHQDATGQVKQPLIKGEYSQRNGWMKCLQRAMVIMSKVSLTRAFGDLPPGSSALSFTASSLKASPNTLRSH